MCVTVKILILEGLARYVVHAKFAADYADYRELRYYRDLWGKTESYDRTAFLSNRLMCIWRLVALKDFDNDQLLIYYKMYSLD